MAETSPTWWRFVESLQGDMTIRELADYLGVSTPTLSRWKRGTRPDPSLVIDVARAADANIIAALVAAGHISRSEAGEYMSGELVLSDVPLSRLLRETARQVEQLENHVGDKSGEAEGSSGGGRGNEILRRLLR